jgi:hypothetical protein
MVTRSSLIPIIEIATGTMRATVSDRMTIATTCNATFPRAGSSLVAVSACCYEQRRGEDEARDGSGSDLKVSHLHHPGVCQSTNA